MAHKLDSEAVEKGVYTFFFDMMDASGYFPITRTEVIEAIESGVKQAVSEYLDAHGLPNSNERPAKPETDRPS